MECVPIHIRAQRNKMMQKSTVLEYHEFELYRACKWPMHRTTIIFAFVPRSPTILKIVSKFTNMCINAHNHTALQSNATRALCCSEWQLAPCQPTRPNTYTYIYTYIYMYIHTYIYIYIYTHIHIYSTT